MSIFFIPIIASKARFDSSPPAASASISTRGVICQEIPHLSLHHPHWLSCPPLPTIAFRLFLIFSRNLERECFVMHEHGTAIEAETRYAQDREFDRQLVALFSAWIVARGLVHGADRAVGKGCSIKAGSSLSVFVVPQANCVLGHCLAFCVGTSSLNGLLARLFPQDVGVVARSTTRSYLATVC